MTAGAVSPPAGGSAEPAARSRLAGRARAARGVDELCGTLAEVCASAVDPLEIAAALEFDGMGDQAVRERYGLADVFALAERMYQRSARAPAEPPPTDDPYRASALRPVLHGLLYGLPAVCFPAAAGLLTGPAALRVVFGSLLASWSLSQGLAYLGYLRLGRVDAAAARRVLRAGLVVCLAAVALVDAAAALAGPASLGALAFALGQGAYLLGASVLLVLGVERRLLFVLAPGVLGGAAFLALGRPAPLAHAAWALLAATPVLALVAAAACTRPGAGPATGRPCTAAELRAALPSACFGLLAAGLLAFPVAVGGGANPAALLAALPLSLSMGAAEWSLTWYRRRTQRLLRSSRRLAGFGRRARVALLAALLRYLVAAAALTAAAVAVAAGAGLARPRWADLPELAAYVALGGAMFLALLLQTFGGRLVTLLACAAALGAEVGFRGAGVPAQLVACAGLLGVLGAHAVVVLGRAVRHSY